MNYLDESLYEYSKTDFYPFHMPGHKRQVHSPYLRNPYEVDITEITDFDNLHHAEGIIKENQELAASLYHADKSWFLINGSTAGILAAVSACTLRGGKLLMARNCHKAVYHAAYLRGLDKSWFLINGSTAGILAAVSACTLRGGKLLMARNCHKAVYHAAYLRGLETTYLYPSYEPFCGLNGGILPEDVEKSLLENEDIQAVVITSPSYDGIVSDYLYPSYEPFCGLNGGILPEDVEKSLLENEDIQAVVITSPSYDGIVSDIAKIAQIVHRYGIPLIVDEAHGAHFAFHQYFPVSALDLGADIVIHSLHKTLPAMTQTALLHKKGDLVSTEKLEEFLGIYETSSPSYILMGGISYCLRFLKEHKKGDLVSTEKLEEFLGIYETSSPSYILMGGISYCLRFLKEQSTEKKATWFLPKNWRNFLEFTKPAALPIF